MRISTLINILSGAKIHLILEFFDLIEISIGISNIFIMNKVHFVFIADNFWQFKLLNLLTPTTLK